MRPTDPGEAAPDAPGARWRERLSRAAASRNASAGLVVAVVVVAAAVYASTHRIPEPELFSRDARGYADMARRLAGGEGFTTGAFWPAELRFGVGRDRPAVVRPPGWPLLLSLPFALFGASAAVVHATVFACYAAAVALAALLATRLAGAGVGLLVAVATATSPQLLMLSIDGISEGAFACWVIGAFVLCANPRRSGVWVGIAAGGAYLTRYNGAVVLGALLFGMALRRDGTRRMLACAAGFALTAAPWWIRNAWVAGDPFYTLLSLNLYFDPDVLRQNASLLYRLDPDPTAPGTVAPFDKFPGQIAELIRHLPPAGVHWAALLGVAWACWRRDALARALAIALGATLVVIAFVIPLARYTAPFAPVVLAIGAAAWARWGGPLRATALALVLLGPLLPPLPSELPDARLARPFVAPLWTRDASAAPPAAPHWPCVERDSLAVAQQAALWVWRTDARAIFAPAAATDFARILDEYPVRYAQIPPARSDLVAEVLARGFTPLDGCGPEVYRRDAFAPPGSPSAGSGASGWNSSTWKRGLERTTRQPAHIDARSEYTLSTGTVM